MIFLTDQWPTYCPKCGTSRGELRDAYTRSDFFAGCSHSCECGAKWQYVETSKLIEATKATGDMWRYVDA
jgi:hypothetical protein